MAAAAPTHTLLTPVDLNNLSSMLHCPVSYEPYSEKNKAVSFVARGAICGHAVSEVMAKQILAERQSRCPMCRADVERYIPNPLVNQLASALLVRGDPVVPLVSAKIELDPEIDVTKIPFPGKGARFEVSEKVDCAPNRDATWRIEFKSQNFESLLRGFTLYGRRDGKLSLYFDCPIKSRDRFLGYLESLPLEGNDCSGYWFTGQWHVKRAFSILSAHNEIPEPEFSLLRRIITENMDSRAAQHLLGIPDLEPRASGEDLSECQPIVEGYLALSRERSRSKQPLEPESTVQHGLRQYLTPPRFFVGSTGSSIPFNPGYESLD